MKEIFESAYIKKIAVVDDDLTKALTFDDLKASDPDSFSAILEDETDPDYESYVNLLEQKGIAVKGIETLVEGLLDPDIRKDAPESLRTLANITLERRSSAAAPVHNVIQWIKDAGFDEQAIDLYASFDDFKDYCQDYDLVLVDYLLKDDSEDSSLALLDHCLNVDRTAQVKAGEDKAEDTEASAEAEGAEGAQLPQIYILMSSYESKLIDNFITLRKNLKTTSSRLRILKKPENENIDKAEWLHTIHQVCEERALIQKIEQFVHEWGTQFSQAANKLSDSMWALDAHSLDILRRTAKDDHVSFPSYFSELILRKVIAEVEAKSQPSKISGELEDSFSSYDKQHPISPGAEVTDSRLYLRELLGDAGWHREEWFKSAPYPILSEHHITKEHDIKVEQYRWLLQNMNFGTVIRNKDSKAIYIHLTQMCDLAHLKFSNRENRHLLLFPGYLKPVDHSVSDNSEVLSPAIYLDNSWKSVIWDLDRAITPAFSNFQNLFERMEVIGQLRYDQAQKIAAQYAARISRVATLRVPAFTEIQGRLITLVKSENKLVWNLETETCSAHLLSYESEKKHLIHFSAKDSAMLALKHYNEDDHEEEIASAHRKMMAGIEIKGGDIKACKILAGGSQPNDLYLLSDSIDAQKIEKKTDMYVDQLNAITKHKKENNIGMRFILMYKL